MMADRNEQDPNAIEPGRDSEPAEQTSPPPAEDAPEMGTMIQFPDPPADEPADEPEPEPEPPPDAGHTIIQPPAPSADEPAREAEPPPAERTIVQFPDATIIETGAEPPAPPPFDPTVIEAAEDDAAPAAPEGTVVQFPDATVIEADPEPPPFDPTVIEAAEDDAPPAAPEGTVVQFPDATVIEADPEPPKPDDDDESDTRRTPAVGRLRDDAPPTGAYTEVFGDAPPPAPPDTPTRVSRPRETPAAPSVAVRLFVPPGAIFPGERINAQVELINQSMAPVNVLLTLADVDEGWARLAQPSVQLGAHARHSVPLVLQPPQSSATVAGRYRLRVVASERASGAPLAAASADFAVAAYERFALALTPADVKHNRTAKLTIRNEGNTASRYSIIGRDAAAMVAFDIATPNVEVAPGASTTVNLKLSAYERRRLGGRETYPFELRVVTSAGVQQTQSGRLVVPPRFGRGAIAILFLALLLLCGGTFVSVVAFAPQLPASIRAPILTPLSGLVPQLPAWLAAQPTATIGPPPEAPSLAVPTDSAPAAPVDVTDVPAATPTATPTDTPEPTPTPEVAAVETLEFGRSAADTPLQAVRVGNGDTFAYLVGGLHAGYSPSSVLVAEEAADYFTANPDAVPPGVTLYIILNLNPDAPEAPADIAGRLNSRGVDLNRNWPCDWTADADVLGAVIPGSGGTAPLSEPETAALAALFDEQPPAVVVAFFARATDGLVTPGRCAATSQVSEAFTTLYGTAAGYRIASFGPIESTLTGDMTDWLDSEGVPALSVILPSRSDADWAANQAGIVALLDAIAP